ncbi:MAG: hypothetical protein ACI9NQ_000109 [Paracoccaceae bacterium]|jgi:hypothetical protein
MKDHHPLDDPQSREASISLRTELRHDFYESADEAEEYILDLTFKVFGEWAPKGSYENYYEIEAGEVHLRIVRLSVAMDETIPLAELFDYDQAMTDLGDLYDWESPNIDFSAPVLEIFDLANSYSDIFSIERMELYPWARRQGLGLRIIQRLLRHWQSGCSLAVIKPYLLEAGVPSNEEGIQKLTRYFSKLGFQPVRNCPYLIRSIEMMAPSTAHVDLPDFLLVPSGLAEEVENEN